MLITLLTILLISNALTIKEDKSILFSRSVQFALAANALIAFNNLYILPLSKGIGIYGGLFHVNTFSHSFNIFVLLISSIILTLTSFYPRRVYTEHFANIFKYMNHKFFYNKTKITNKKGEQFRILEYSLIIVFILTGSVFLMSSSDLISIFLSIELQSYGLYILSTLYRDSEKATSGGLTYFLLGGLSSCFILLGSSLLYSNTGTTSLEGIYVINSISEVHPENVDVEYSSLYTYTPNYLNISLIILSVGFLFKISAAPFHFWSPDVYDSIPTIVTTYVAIIAKISIFIFFLELVYYTEKNGYGFTWTNCLLISSLFSLIIGAVLGLTQFRIKRLYAYSTISHLGFMLLALSINSVESIQAYIFYIITYTVSNLNAFVILLAIGYTLYLYVYKEKNKGDISNNKDTGDIPDNKYTPGVSVKEDMDDKSHKQTEAKETKYDVNRVIEITADLGKDDLNLRASEVDSEENDEKSLKEINNSPIQLISQLKGYFEINPYLALSLGITLFSFVGVPPLIGFFAKQMVLSAALDNGYIFMAIIAILTSVIAAVYYLNVIKQIFFFKNDYIENPTLHNQIFPGLILNRDGEKETVAFSSKNIVLSASLTITISILTLILVLFIYIPNEWFSVANILAIILFKP